MIYIGIAIFALGCLVALISIASELENICKAIKELTNEVNDLKFRL